MKDSSHGPAEYPERSFNMEELSQEEVRNLKLLFKIYIAESITTSLCCILSFTAYTLEYDVIPGFIKVVIFTLLYTWYAHALMRYRMATNERRNQDK